MATVNVPYYECIQRTLHAALCLANFPSRGVERHNKPEVEVAGNPSPDLKILRADPNESSSPVATPASPASPGSIASASAASGGQQEVYHMYAPELLLNPILICRSENERCLIEGSINSVRVSVAFQKADHLAELIAKKYVGFLEQRANFFFILRKKPIPGYDMSFLITHEEAETMHVNKIIDFIVAFIMDIDKDITGMKLNANERARGAAMEFFQSLSF